MSYGVQSPSKFTSLDRLEQIRQDNCIAASGKEYSEYEMDQMIMEKKILQAEREYLNFCKEEFKQSEFDEIMSESLSNEDMILGRDYGILIIEGKSIGERTIVKVIRSGKNNPYKLRSQASFKRYGFKTRMLALEFCLRSLENMKTDAKSLSSVRAEKLVKNRERREEFRQSISVGSILSASWGYEQTQVEFYKVLEVKGVKVKIQEMSLVTVDGSEGRDCCRVVPGVVIGDPETRTIGTWAIKIDDSIGLTLWDGKPEYKSWYC